MIMVSRAPRHPARVLTNQELALATNAKNARNPLGRQAPSASPRPHKTAILLAQRIIGEITDDGHPPGTMLPPEREMLEHYGVARGTLREALRYLEMQGVLAIKPGPGGGPEIKGFDPRSLASVIAMLLHLSGAPFATVLETRQVLEPGTAALAAARIDDEALGELRQSIAAMDATVGDTQAFIAENRTFHAIIARASGNHLFELLLGSLAWIIDATALGVTYSARRQKAVVAAHQRIYDTLEAGDPASAEQAMTAHMEEFERFMRRDYGSVLRQTIRWDTRVL